MWFYYLLSAIGVSVGTGALVAYDSEQQIAAVIKASEPETHAENTARISRALRRLHQMNPGAFPSAGGAPARIPDNLLAAASMGGIKVPQDVIFEIDASGRISSRVANRSTMNTDRFSGAIDREGLDVSGTMNRVARNIGLIRNPDPYNYHQTPNLEGVRVGDNVAWSGGGITNPEPGSGSSGSGGNYDVVAGNPNVVFVPYAGSDDEDNSQVGNPNDDYDDDGYSSGGGNGDDEAFDKSKAPRAYADDPEHENYDVERAFDRSCFTVLFPSDDELQQLMIQFDAERRTHYQRRIEAKYDQKIRAFKMFHQITLPGIEAVLATALDPQAKRIAQNILQGHYDAHPEWKRFQTLGQGISYYNNMEEREKDEAPAHINRETIDLLDGIEASRNYCIGVYDRRADSNNANMPADSLSPSDKRELKQGTQGIVDRDLKNDPDINRGVTQTMKRAKTLIHGTIDVRDIIQNYQDL